MSVVGRIRTEKNGGAWCPKSQISRDVYEWIQVDLGELKVITQVETQGRFGNGQVRVPFSNAVIIIAIRLRYDYDPTTTYRACLLPFDVIRREQKMNMSIFRRSRIVVESQL